MQNCHSVQLSGCLRFSTESPTTLTQKILGSFWDSKRRSFIEIEDPVTGLTMRLPNVSFRIPGYSGRIRFPGLPVGIANEVIYEDLLGYRPQEIEEFRKVRAI